MPRRPPDAGDHGSAANGPPSAPPDLREDLLSGSPEPWPVATSREGATVDVRPTRTIEALRQGVITCSSRLIALAEHLGSPSRTGESIQTLGQALVWLRHAESTALDCAHQLQNLVLVLAKDIRLRRRLEVELVHLRSELKRVRRQLEESRVDQERSQFTALHDPLTGLPNRAAFDALSSRVIDPRDPRSRKLGLMFIDVDGFKAVNDLNGHDVGDELLKVVGSRLTHAVRIGDLVCRHGGDEFLCLLHDIDDKVQCGAIAKKMFDLVSAPVRIGAREFSVTPSIGIVLFPQDGADVDTLIRNADRAMYWAKKSHVGHAFFSDLPASRRPSRRRPARPATRPS